MIKELALCMGITDPQAEVLAISYNVGKEHDLGYTIAAIALQESNAGKYNINLIGGAFGAHQITIKTAATRLGIETTWEKDRLAERLLTDTAFSANMAVLEISYWLDYHAGDWLETWSSYYAGFSYERHEWYGNEIKSHINELKECI